MTLPTDASSISKIVIISSNSGLLVDCPNAGELCTHSKRTEVPGANAAARSLLLEVNTPGSIPTASMLQLSRTDEAGIVGAASQCGKRRSFETIARLYYDLRYPVTDVYPRTDVEIDFANGSIIRLYSETQEAYGLPWTIQYRNIVFTSYNRRISALVAAIGPGPGDYALTHDLLGESLVSDLLRSACRR